MKQLIINAVISTGLLAMVSWSFSIIFKTTKILHIAHAVIYTLAVYLFIAFDKLINVWYISAIIALAGTAIIALLMEILVYRPLFQKGVNQNITLISSLGLQILGVNAIAMIFGNDIKMIDAVKNTGYFFGEIIITKVQFMQIGVSAFVLVCLFLFFKFSESGLKIRAVASRHNVASVLGINVLKTRNVVFILGSIIAGIAALLKAADVGIGPNTGMNVILAAIVVVILNRKDSIIGIVVVSLLITLIHNLTEWYFSSQVKEAVTYFLLIVVLLWRTDNILEYKMRVEEK